jgi:hypothetical protein
MKAHINWLSRIALEGAMLLIMLLFFLPQKFMEDGLIIQTNNTILWRVLEVPWLVALYEHLVGFLAEQLLAFKANLNV